jgi:hypothetical protein
MNKYGENTLIRPIQMFKWRLKQSLYKAKRIQLDILASDFGVLWPIVSLKESENRKRCDKILNKKPFLRAASKFF